MSKQSALADAFRQTVYKVPGHGDLVVQNLRSVLEQIDGDLESDRYGSGKIIEDFQDKMAAYLGKEKAVFLPSGTMAQQIALRIWCDQRGVAKVAYHPLAHLEIHEQDALRELHHIEPVLLADKDSLIRLKDVENMPEDVSCLLLELPQREIGGQLPSYEELEAISQYCRERGIKLHMDGARLFEITPYYGRSAAEISSLFDSVYVSFYKGIGGIAGAILAGDADFVETSKIWKRRHGGDLISLYPYILTADYYFQQRVDKMQQYHEDAKSLAGLYNDCHRITTRPVEPVSNMFHVHIDVPKEQLEPLLIQCYAETGIGLTSYLVEAGESSCAYEVSVGDRYALLPKERLTGALQWLDQKLKES
ncbi:threonine aldolase family protein [Paenibacillus guangzhouensis]|uniref:threonine aldolase family protein n=1 Tax=Paenibacillus guangzhouensis TaxID=1473112 RepID=UPI0012676A24|nr:beta-eliminating lyase-related protein [Paenibacillus guangzhouensis]